MKNMNFRYVRFEYITRLRVCLCITPHKKYIRIEKKKLVTLLKLTIALVGTFSCGNSGEAIISWGLDGA